MSDLTANENQNPLNFDFRTRTSDTLRDRIAAVQAQHHHWDYAGALTCACGETFGLGVEAGWEAAVAGWAAHVADAVIRELGLEPQVHYDPDCEFYRYVTDWIAPND